MRTLSSALLVKQAEIEEKYGLSYSDSLIAASALATYGAAVSDDAALIRCPTSGG